MIIYLDTLIEWQPTAGDLDDSTRRRYYAAPRPHLAILVLKEPVAVKYWTNLEFTKRKYTATVGWHGASAPLGYTLPEYAGYKHSKLTLWEEVDQSTAHSMTLSEFLAGCPTDQEPGEYSNPLDAEIVTAELPAILVSTARALAVKHGHSLESLIWYTLHEWTLDNR